MNIVTVTDREGLTTRLLLSEDDDALDVVSHLILEDNIAHVDLSHCDGKPLNRDVAELNRAEHLADEFFLYSC